MQDKNGYAAIWDMDGTLVDTAELHFEAWAATAERGRPFSRDDFANTFGRRNPEIIHILFGESSRETNRSTSRIVRNCCIGRRPAKASCYCRAFERCSKTSTGRASDRPLVPAPRANIELILRLTGVEQFFPAVVAMEDTQRGKPDPQVFQFGLSVSAFRRSAVSYSRTPWPAYRWREPAE